MYTFQLAFSTSSKSHRFWGRIFSQCNQLRFLFFMQQSWTSFTFSPQIPLTSTDPQPIRFTKFGQFAWLSLFEIYENFHTKNGRLSSPCAQMRNKSKYFLLLVSTAGWPHRLGNSGQYWRRRGSLLASKYSLCTSFSQKYSFFSQFFSSPE